MESLEKIEEQTAEKQFLTGIGGIELKKDRKTLPAVEVANEVSWVNNKMNLPFGLKVGDQSRLGMFLTSDEASEKQYPIEITKDQSRSGILGRVIFSDKEGRLYRDIDLKGLGYTKLGYKDYTKHDYKGGVGSVGEEVSPRTRGWYFIGTAGIANQELIRRDIDFSEKFLKAGIRTHRVIAMIDLKEIIDADGKKISIDEAKERKILKKDDEPVIEVRAFGVRSRLSDISSNWNNPDLVKKLFFDARTMVAQELKRRLEGFTGPEYLVWLVETTAINIARMHHKKWVHGFLSTHNLTLDGRIVDLDSVENIKEHERRVASDPTEDVIKNFEKDSELATQSLEQFTREVRVHGLTSYINVNDCFKSVYNSELEKLKSKKNKSKN